VTGRSSSTPPAGHELTQESAATGLPASLVILLVALVLVAAAGGMTVLLRRRNYDRRYGPVPPPRRPYDDQPNERFDRAEKLNGPRSR
jgi:hypothetical protein